MSESTPGLSRCLFAKTALGQEEIQSRALQLGPMVQRLPILVDGKRSYRTLSSLIAGQALDALLNELQTKGCIAVSTVQPKATTVVPQAHAPNPVSPVATPATPALYKLPEAGTRSAKEVDMVRNFMMNTVNTMFQKNSRLTSMEAIFFYKTAEDVRRVYPKWSETMSARALGARRLQEFRKKPFQVL